MKLSDFSKDSRGQVIRAAGGYDAFVPNRLPPKLELTWELAACLSRADRRLAELAGAARTLPSPHLLIAPFIRREAVLSSQIEGTQASLSDLFLFEAAPSGTRHPGRESVSDVREVANYVHALGYGLKRLETLPISLRLIRELHERLMEGVRGDRLTPGEFRRSQNWIGRPGCTLDEAVFVPPPVEEMTNALSDLESFLHSPSTLPPLVRMAMAHYQFEAIHPFVDGNGRIGRLLISLLLCHEGLLDQPLLYLSACFERRRDDYYRLLLDVSRQGSWTAWIEFFLAAVEEQSRDVVWRTGKLLELRQQYRSGFETARSSALLLALVDDLFETPVLMIPRVSKRLKITHRAAMLNVRKLVDAGIVEEVTGRVRSRIFMARGILKILEQAETPAPGASHPLP
jgi:Fic family protein